VHDESAGRARLLVVLGKDGGCETLLVIQRREKNPAFSIDVSCRAGSSSASTPTSTPV
jgi:hypothetical protein